MKRLFLIAIMAALTAPLFAEARDRDFYPRSQAAQGQQTKKGQGDFQRGGQDFRREREARPRDERRSSGRMTEEERRELHRDLDRANREIYRQGRGR